MKKIIVAALAAMTLFACAKDVVPGNDKGNKESVVKIAIHVDKTTAVSRAIEPGHGGTTGEEITPVINSAMVIAYSKYGVALTRIDLTPAQMREALYGNLKYTGGEKGQTTKPAEGVSIGLPVGTEMVDVILNTSSSTYNTDITNINYFNYRDNKDGDGNKYDVGENNFERTLLVTNALGKGVALAGNETTEQGNPNLPSYAIDFEVRPALARFEVYGGINVAAPEVWVDKYNNRWSTMTVTAYEGATDETADANTGAYLNGAVKGTALNGFDVNTVYIPEYYWHTKSGVADKTERIADNSFDTEDAMTSNAGWVKNSNFSDTALVNWNPNAFYAVDVEEVFVNNIHVRSIEHDPYMHPWPGAAVANWGNWYAAYHINGWHTAGTSADNTFLCMGNMWDRLAASDKTTDITIPNIGGITTMTILNGKAKKIDNVSEFYSTDRNLGVTTGKAVAFQVYAQSKLGTTGEMDKEGLAQDLPHIIVKVKCYDNAADYAAGKFVATKQFITVKLFSNSSGHSTKSYITSFERGNLYRFNLDDLRYAFVGGAPVPGGEMKPGIDPTDPVDPDPELPGAELIMTVKVMPWTIKNIYPEV